MVWIDLKTELYSELSSNSLCSSDLGIGTFTTTNDRNDRPDVVAFWFVNTVVYSVKTYVPQAYHKLSSLSWCRSHPDNTYQVLRIDCHTGGVNSVVVEDGEWCYAIWVVVFTNVGPGLRFSIMRASYLKSLAQQVIYHSYSIKAVSLAGTRSLPSHRSGFWDRFPDFKSLAA